MHGVSGRVSPLPAIVPVPSPPRRCTRRRRRSAITCRALKLGPSVEEESGSVGCHPVLNPKGCFCHCGRRGLLSSSLSALIPFHPFLASAAPPTDPTLAVEMVHPSRPQFYEELYAKAMSTGMKAYETEVSYAMLCYAIILSDHFHLSFVMGYKEKLFSNLGVSGMKVLELGVGTGPNFKYYANNTNLSIITAVDPNKQMEKYARSSAKTAGLPLSNFNFLRGVGEALPVDDESMDAVIGTLVLCSVKDVDATLKEVQRVLKPGGQYIYIEHVAAQDGTFLRFVQGVVDPLQQLAADGCHLTRETGKQIAEVGFSRLSLNNTFLKSVSLFGPHVYGVACK